MSEYRCESVDNTDSLCHAVRVGVQTQTAHRHNTSCINSLLVATIYGATSFSMAIELRNDNSSWYSVDYNNKIT